MNNDIAISIKDVSKKYKLYDKPIDRLKEALHPFKKQYHKEFYALKNINLEVKKGEVLGIVGVNGAGKSTLLKMIANVLSPTSGFVNVQGSLNAILELNAGLKPELSGIDNIKLNLKINGVQNDEQKLLDDIVDFADIGEYIDQPVKTYSSGMKSRLGFGIATSTKPDILIVDEVLAVGDALFRKKCYERIRFLVESGKTVIFVSHSVNAVIEFCTRAVLISHKRIILDDTPKKVTDFYEKLVFSNQPNDLIDTLHVQSEMINDEQPVEPNEYPLGLINDKLLEVESNVVRSSDLVNLDSIMILSNNLERTNVLSCNEEYDIHIVLSIKEHFSSEIKHKLLGVTFANQKGLRIAGLQLKLSAIGHDKFLATGTFKCLLNPGLYSILFAVKDYDNSPNYELFILDAELIEVKNNSDQIRWALMHLENIA